jgi:hypothetical protein
VRFTRELREEGSGPLVEGRAQYRELPGGKVFHSSGRLGAGEKAPASSVFSVVNTACARCFSTGVEKVGEVI